MMNLKEMFLEGVRKQILEEEEFLSDSLEGEENYLFIEQEYKRLEEDLSRLAYICLERGVPAEEVRLLFEEEEHEVAFQKAFNAFYYSISDVLNRK